MSIYGSNGDAGIATFGIILTEKEARKYYKAITEEERGETLSKVFLKDMIKDYNFYDPNFPLFCTDNFYGVAYGVCDNGQTAYDLQFNYNETKDSQNAKDSLKVYKEAFLEYIDEPIFFIPWSHIPNPIQKTHNNIDEFIDAIVCDYKEYFTKTPKFRSRLFWITGYYYI